MRSKLMDKHNVDPQDPVTMVFNRLYEDALKKARKMEREHGLGKMMGEEMIRELNRQKESPMKNDPINIRADGTSLYLFRSFFVSTHSDLDRFARRRP